MIVDALILYLLQIGFTLGSIILFGLLMNFLNVRFYRNFGRLTRPVCYLTGFIGTPIHELAHAGMCLLFGHKIVELVLFRPDPETGTLGYVRHTYKRTDLYQNIGNFFIGYAPIFVGFAILCTVFYFLLPNLFAQCVLTAKEIAVAGVGIKAIGATFGKLLVYLFTTALTDPFWWLFIAVGSFVALHMTLSGTDIKGSIFGGILVLLLVAVVDAVLMLISMPALLELTRYTFVFASLVISFGTIFLASALTLVIISFPIKKIFRL